MRMQEEEVLDAGKSGENGEPADQSVQEAPAYTPDLTISQKYRELKSKLKYLVYEHRYFEAELNKAQSKLIELSQDKTVLLDQLLQYEPVSGEEEEMTDYSGSEDEVTTDSRVQRPVPVAKPQLLGESSGKLSSSLKTNSVRQPSRSPVRDSSLPPVPKPANLTKQGIAKATAIINSVSNNIASKVSKAGTKRQAKPPSKAGSGVAVKISKTISRVRQNNVPDTPSTLLSAGLAGGLSTNKQKLVVSYPITSISTTESVAPPSTLTTLTVSTVSTTPLALSAASKPLNRPIPALTKTQPPSLPSSSSSSLHISSVGSVHVAAISAPQIPPLIPDTGKGRGQNSSRSSSTSSTSSSSSSSDSGESGSDLSSGSEDEAMDTGDTRREVGKGPVQLVSSVKSAGNLPRPKAILSPVKMAPPMLMKGSVLTPPPAVVSPQPAFSGWNQSQGMTSAEGNSPLMMVSEVGGFAPLSSPLTSPSSALPFSSLNNPGASVSAFQVFSPKRVTPPSQTALASLPRSSSSSAKTTPTPKVETTSNSAGHSAKS